LNDRLAGRRAKPPKYIYNGYQVHTVELIVGLTRSRASSTVSYLINLLSDEGVPGTVRNEVYRNLAATGSPKAIKLLKEIRKGSRKREPRSRVVDLNALDRHGSNPLKGTYTDPEGVKWGLTAWDGLGCVDDLWLVHKEDGQWVDPIFTGECAYWDTPDFGVVDHTQAGEDEAKRHHLIYEGGWIREFISDPSLRRDLDRDGMRDVEERWLGLDLMKQDMDGDGLLDGEDKNPLTPGGPLNDTQQILAAAFDAASVGRNSKVTAIVEWPSGISAFELTSWRGLVFASTAAPRRLLGAKHFSIGRPFDNGIIRGPSHPIRFSPDGKEVSVNVEESIDSGSVFFVVVLRRFGADWLPVRVEDFGTLIS
jgi:hypothetical protein